MGDRVIIGATQNHLRLAAVENVPLLSIPIYLIAWPGLTYCRFTQGLRSNDRVLISVRGGLPIYKDGNRRWLGKGKLGEINIEFTQCNQRIDIVTSRIAISGLNQFLERNAGARRGLGYQSIFGRRQYGCAVVA